MRSVEFSRVMYIICSKSYGPELSHSMNKCPDCPNIINEGLVVYHIQCILYFFLVKL